MNQENHLTKYVSDRDIPESIWKKYMKKYDKKYHTFIDKDNIHYIKCRRGKIGMWSILNKEAMYCSYPLTKKQKTYFLQKMAQKAPKTFQIMQEGDYDFVIKFVENNIISYENLLEVYKRMNLSDAERKRRSELMKKICPKKK